MSQDKPSIAGYRALDEAEVQAINEIKAMASEVEALIFSIQNRPAVTHDPRWVAIAVTDLQKGFMSLTRAVAQPSNF